MLSNTGGSAERSPTKTAFAYPLILSAVPRRHRIVRDRSIQTDSRAIRSDSMPCVLRRPPTYRGRFAVVIAAKCINNLGRTHSRSIGIEAFGPIRAIATVLSFVRHQKPLLPVIFCRRRTGRDEVLYGGHARR